MEVIMKTEMLCVFADLGVFALNPASPVRFIMEYASLNPLRKQVSRKDGKVRKDLN